MVPMYCPVAVIQERFKFTWQIPLGATSRPGLGRTGSIEQRRTANRPVQVPAAAPPHTKVCQLTPSR